MDRRTVMVALAALMGRCTGAPTLQFAGLLPSAVPAHVVYIIFQRIVIKGCPWARSSKEGSGAPLRLTYSAAASFFGAPQNAARTSSETAAGISQPALSM